MVLGLCNVSVYMPGIYLTGDEYTYLYLTGFSIGHEAFILLSSCRHTSYTASLSKVANLCALQPDGTTAGLLIHVSQKDVYKRLNSSETSFVYLSRKE